MVSIVHKAENQLREWLQTGLSPDHSYHNLAHTIGVVNAVRLLASRHALAAADAETLELAAWFHDAGFVSAYDGHEEAGAKKARLFLEQEKYNEEGIKGVEQLILATKPDHEPQTLLEKIIKDADLSHLGRADYFAVLSGLRHELEVFLNKKYTDDDWYKMNHQFVKNHQFYSPQGATIYGLQYQQNKKMLKKLAQKNEPVPEKTKSKKKAAEAKRDTRTGDSIATNRSAQMMFKTALRNHMDLSNLADNKANIMLSVNALIVTIAVPMAAGYVNDAPHLMMPVIVLLLTCLTSMIFATLATRPIPMTGTTSMEDIKQGKSNLFFFGNFYRMGLKEYDEGINQVLKEETNLESAIKRDLFFLGSSLGKKYNQLRICYNVFMVGVVLSVIFFGLSYAIFQ